VPAGFDPRFSMPARPPSCSSTSTARSGAAPGVQQSETGIACG
jgi:hypothetical protein